MDQRRLHEFRLEKDHFLRHDPRSPLPEHLRHSFEGLDYYPPNSALDLELELEPGDGSDVRVGTTDGAERVYRRAGRIRFEVESEEAELTLYDTGPHQHGLFLPFRDSTSGKESYGAGRYLDLEPPREGKVRVDFNFAYNPSCVYDDNYSCPLPPPENWLSVPISAGEKTFKRPGLVSPGSLGQVPT